MTTTRSPLPHVPCRRPHVTIEAHPKTFETGSTATYHLVTCNVPGCDWTYDAAVAIDAADKAKWHRAAHRTAVPTVESKHIDDPEGGTRLVDQCQFCGWVTPRGFSTAADRKRKTEEHLVEHHGLVTC